MVASEPERASTNGVPLPHSALHVACSGVAEKSGNRTQIRQAMARQDYLLRATGCVG